ncbi:MAG: hypothetical protein H6728_01790 [Myxococcales bacterium]|nr:hypothetical protein [Myxococcales bacterium]
MYRIYFCLFVFLLLSGCQAFVPDWSEQAKLPASGERANLYQASPDDWKASIERGKMHMLVYPVTTTGLLVPFGPLQRIIEDSQYDGIESFIFGRSFSTIPELYEWLGLSLFPTDAQNALSVVPFPSGQPQDIRMGAGLLARSGTKGLTFSCAACHAGTFFGVPILGLNARRPRANEIFVLGKQLESVGYQGLTDFIGKLDAGEDAELKKFLENLKSVGVQKPLVLGLDTSLAQVARSLARRKDDPYATKDDALAKTPRQMWPEDFVADSKPMVWWTMKYKTRWLADGSVVSGNPVFTNFLWNEIGRGADLHELETWLDENADVVKDLTAAVFATQAPRYGDFFGWESIDLAQAKAGQKIFQERCSRCHGTYEKGWDDPTLSQGSLSEQMQTTKVRYPEQTPVHDVGTDPQRAQGMAHFADALNNLAISKKMNTLVVPQKGYVPPPLSGIFARYPYLHNNSIPNLCALLTPAAQRPTSFYQGPAENKQTDIDLECMGYPTGDAIPEAWKQEKYALFDATKPGLSNKGHDVGIFADDQGRSLLSPEQQKQLIVFLKTL